MELQNVMAIKGVLHYENNGQWFPVRIVGMGGGGKGRPGKDGKDGKDGFLPYGNGTKNVPSNTYIAPLNAPTPINFPGLTFEVMVNADNLGGDFLNINGLGALPITDSNNTPVVVGMMEANSVYLFVFNPDGSDSYQLLGLAKPSDIPVIQLGAGAGSSVRILNGNSTLSPYATVSGGKNNTSSGSGYYQGYSTVGGGGNNTASNYYTTVGGGSGNSASNYFSTVGGGQTNLAPGKYAFIGGSGGNTVSAYIGGTVGGGGSNTASGSGYYQGYTTVAGGLNNIATASGYYGGRSTVGGGENNLASADYSHIAGGYQAVAYHYGESAQASGKFTVDGDAQRMVVTLRNRTSGNTPVELYLDGLAERLTIPFSGSLMTAWKFTVDLVGLSAGNGVLSRQFQGVILNAGGVTTVSPNINPAVVPLVSPTGYETQLSQPVGLPTAKAIIDLPLSSAFDSLVIKVTGEAGKSIAWVASVEITQVKFTSN